LILSSQTLRKIPIPLRAEAAAAAGFTGIGVHHEDLELVVARGARWDVIRHDVEAEGVRVVEAGFLHRWAGEETEAAAERDAVFELAMELGAFRVNAGLFSSPSRAEVVDRFQALCRAAAVRGLRVSLEFFPFGALPDAFSAWDVLENAGEPNADLLFDVWHWHRGGAQTAALAAIPAGSIGCLQLSDAAPRVAADVGEESRHGRLVPGTGAIDLVGLLRGLTAAGHHPPIAVEVLSDELSAMGPQRAAALVGEATRQVLEAAAWAV
jgi:sugar phosphate isomerase/epimerase